jgi:hypothetical protein
MRRKNPGQQEILQLEDLTIHVTRKNIKNMYLRVKTSDGAVEISAPLRTQAAAILAFVNERRPWITQARAHMREKELAKEEQPVVVPFMEREMRYQLKKEIAALLAKWEPVMGVKSSGFTIRKMKSRWGSCNVKTHHLNFNLALARVPEACLEYVVVHELTHLLEPSHNDRFWGLMEFYLPGAKQRRKELRAYG